MWAARAGHVAVLDGIHRIHSSTISVLHRLVHDREMQLYDGRRLVNHVIYDELVRSGKSEAELEANGLLRIHPSFRIIALADPPVVDKGNNWLTPEMLSLFMFHDLRNLTKVEEKEIIKKLVSDSLLSPVNQITVVHSSFSFSMEIQSVLRWLNC